MKQRIKLPYRIIVIVAYSYMMLPIVVFFCGWLRTPLAVLFSTIFLVGGGVLIKREYKHGEIIEINILSILIILVVSCVWVYTSGIGGFFPQRADWHWRNAILRDLINYSWPVQYPNNGSTLVYYFNYFLIPALVGKVLGWNAANFSMFLITWIGVSLSMLLVYKYLKFCDAKQVMILVLVFVVWSGFEAQRFSLGDLLNLDVGYPYQYSPNNTLLQWVTNQTIVPWIAVPLMLDRRKISTYVFVGMCVLASAPLPFIGICIIMLVDGIYQLFTVYKKDVKNWIKDAMSLPNVCSICSVLVVYALFYMCNTASNGSEGTGGFGLYIPVSEFKIQHFIALVSFLLYNYGIYAILLYKKYKANVVYWGSTISLMVIPLFKVGTSNDFCMRASIPALFVFMILVVEYLATTTSDEHGVCYSFIIGLVAISTISVYTDTTSRMAEVKLADNKEELWADGIVSFSNKVNEGYYGGLQPINFLCEAPEETIFFSKLGKKSDNLKENDMNVSQSYLEQSGFCFSSGKYEISPQGQEDKFLDITEKGLSLSEKKEKVLLSDSTVNCKYELYSDNDKVCNFDKQTRTVTLLDGGGTQYFGLIDVPEQQLFEIVEKDGYYLICWNNQYALTYNDEEVYWADISNGENQCWKIK